MLCRLLRASVDLGSADRAGPKNRTMHQDQSLAKDNTNCEVSSNITELWDGKRRGF